MSIPTRLSTYLEQQGVHYELCAHEPSRTSAETARSAHVMPHQLAKGVLLEDAQGCVLAVVPGDKNVVVEELAEMLGRDALRLADEQRIVGMFQECDRGALPPVGMAWGVQTVVDDEVMACEHVYLEGGDHRLLLRMGQDEFGALMSEARHGHFCRPVLH